MVDLEVLKRLGSTNDRLREIFTATASTDQSSIPPEEKRRIDADCAVRKRIEEQVASRLDEAIQFSLKNYQLYTAVDLAWDAPPIAKETVPLVLYAQGRVDISACADQLANLGLSGSYVKRDHANKIVGIDMPKFFDVNVNLIRSMVSRRLAAQVNKYNNLYPFYRFWPRSTSQVAKLYGEVVDEIVEQQVDEFDHRHQDAQWMRDMLLYGFSTNFVTQAWVRDEQVRFSASSDMMPLDKRVMVPTIVREGVTFCNIHPTRVFKDPGCSWSDINSDLRISFCGYWDVVPYRCVGQNTDYFNRDSIQFSNGFTNLFTTFGMYWSTYYTNISVPSLERSTATTAAEDNDIRLGIGRYSTPMGDASTLLAVYFLKITPLELGCGTYPHPVWLRLVVAGQPGTVVFAEWLPSRPGFASAHNWSDSRRANLSFAMEMMPYQDMLTNLVTQLLSECKSAQFKIVTVNTDIVTKQDVVDEMRKSVTGKHWFEKPFMLEYSGSKMATLGLDVKSAASIIQPVSAPGSIQILFQAIVQVIALAERLAGMSPNESGQPIVRGNGGVTATEAQQIENTTTTMYSFISEAVDEARAAKKRILLESYIAFGDDKFQVSVTSRFPKAIVVKAGFTPVDDDDILGVNSDIPTRYSIVGRKHGLLKYTYIFTSRDGAERASNVQSANTLVQLLPLLQQPGVIEKIGRDKFFEIVNEIFRLSGAGVDLRIEPDNGPDTIGAPQQPQTDPKVEEALSNLTDIAEQHSAQISAMSGGIPAQQAPPQAPAM